MGADLDDIDRAILRALMADARTPLSEVARRVDMAGATVHDRVERLEDAGVLEGYHAAVDPEAVGLAVAALVGIDTEPGSAEAVAATLREVDAVRSLHLVAGRYDAVARVLVADTAALEALLVETLGAVDGVAGTESLVVLDTPFEHAGVPL